MRAKRPQPGNCVLCLCLRCVRACVLAFVRAKLCEGPRVELSRVSGLPLGRENPGTNPGTNPSIATPEMGPGMGPGGGSRGGVPGGVPGAPSPPPNPPITLAWPYGLVLVLSSSRSRYWWLLDSTDWYLGLRTHK